MGRELTRTEKTAIRRLVSKWCANYDRDCGCLPLDCECYMFGKCWTGAYCLSLIHICPEDMKNETKNE